jgi:hypothetical protein
MRVIGYIDGMNFYGASKDKRWYPSGWCNWSQTIGAYCVGAEVSIRYFTTLYAGKDQKRAGRQKLHLRAMKEIARADIVYGSCRERPLTCPGCGSRLKCQREDCGCERRLAEKMTDVNIALRLFEDAIDGLFERAYLVSADVDLIPAIHTVMRRAPEAQVIVLLPPETEMADDFANLEQAYPGRAIARHLDLDKMRRFPDDLPRKWNMTLPTHWRENAGARPARPGHENAPLTNRDRARGPVPWFEESIGYGTKNKSGR